MNRIARKPVVSKFQLPRSRPLPNVYRLSRLAQLVSFYVNYAYLVNIYVKLHMRVGGQDLLRSHISQEWFVCLVQKESLFKFQRDIPNERSALDCTENTCTTCQKLATKIKAFHSAFEVQDLAANGTCRQITLLT